MKIKHLLILLLPAICAQAMLGTELIHNSRQDLDAAGGKIELKIIRTWGGDNETDENKFFKLPSDILIDKEKLIYFCDQYNQCLKVFDDTGKYLTTIGRMGRGPGDLYGPLSIAFSPTGDIWVGEMHGRRVQCLNKKGQAKHIFKVTAPVNWIGVTQQNQVMVYSHSKTFLSRKLLLHYNEKGKLSGQIGEYHDESNSMEGSEYLEFTMDSTDGIYAANKGTPVIRKYNRAGRLERVITFAVPFPIPVQVTLNARGDEIQMRHRPPNDNVGVRKEKGGVSIRIGGRDPKWPSHGICRTIATDDRQRIYVVTQVRLLTERERKGTIVFGNSRGLNRSKLDAAVVGSTDINYLLVFDPGGQVEAVARLSTFCDKIYIRDDRLFIIDGFFNQRVLEYRMRFRK